MANGDIYGVFVYPDSSVEHTFRQLFDAVKGSTSLTTVTKNMVALAGDENILFSVDLVYDQSENSFRSSVTPEPACIFLRRGEGGVLYGEEPGRDQYIDLFLEIYEHLPERPGVGYMMDGEQASGIADGTVNYHHPITGDSLAASEFNDASWVMIFPPEMVEQYGKATLRELPIRQFKVLEDGSVVMVAPGDPTVYTEWRKVARDLGLAGAKDRPIAD